MCSLAASQIWERGILAHVLLWPSYRRCIGKIDKSRQIFNLKIFLADQVVLQVSQISSTSIPELINAYILAAVQTILLLLCKNYGVK